MSLKKNLYLNWGFRANVFRKLRQPPAEEPRIQAPFSTLPSQPCSPPPLALSGPKWQISSLWKYVVKSSKDILYIREKVTKKNTRLGLKQEPHPAELIPVSVAWSDRCLSITGYFTHWCKNIHAPQKSNLSPGVVILLFHTFLVLKAENDQLICFHSFLIFLDTSDSSINKIKFACFSFIIINYFLMVLESFIESVFYSFFLVKELFLQMISLLFQLTNLGKLFFVEQCTQSQLNHIPPTSSQPSIHPDPTAFLVN